MWLKVQPEGDSAVTFNWGNADGPHPCIYPIGRATLVGVAEKIRNILDQLADWAKFRDKEQLCDLLHDLAVEGKRLRFVIFDCPQKAPDLAKLEEWIGDQYSAGDRELKITADPNLHIPWGLAFDGNPRMLREPANTIADTISHCDQFWAFKFALSMIFSACERPSRTRQERESCRLLSVVNAAVLSEVQKELPDNFNNLSEILELPVGTAYNLERCDALVQEASRKDTLFHFFGHGANGILDLGTDKIDVVTFKMIMERLLDRRNNRSNSSYNLIFLNACETVTGQLDASFRDAASQPGLCGLIATEATVPRPFAANFGYRFLKSILIEGRSIGDTMETLRRDPDLWPLSLLYSCYAVANHRFEPARPNHRE